MPPEENNPQFDHPTEPMLGALIESNERNSEATHILLENIIQQSDAVEPLLSNQLETQQEILQEMKKPKDEVQRVSIEGAQLVTIKGEKGDKGDPGFTPKKGDDYFTEDDISKLVEMVQSQIRVPEDGKTPEVGTDYFTDQDIRNFIETIESRIRTPEDGKDAVVDYDKVVSEVLAIMPKPVPGPKGDPGKDGSPDTTEQLLAKLKGNIPYSYIKDPPTIFKEGGRVGGAGYLGELSDVDLTGLANNNVLKWNASQNKWVVGTASSGGGGTWGSITGTLSDQTDLQAALNAKEGSITAGTSGQYWRGDKTWQTLDKTAVGLGNVDNTSDLNKPISTATQSALDLKQGLNQNLTDIAGLADPNADRLLFWDDSAGAYTHLTLGTNLSITGTTINATAGAGGLSDGDYGDVTVSGTGTVMTIDNDVVTYAKMQNVSATSRILGRITAGAGDVEELTAANVKTILALTTADVTASTNKNYVTDAQLVVIGNTSGTNTGDQTSIVGITGTKAQFDTAVTDGNFLYVGDITQYTDEMAQDAIGAMIDGTLVYTDGTPLLSRAALTGAITASAGSNATALGSFTKAQLDTAVSDGNVLYVGDVTQYTDELAQDAVGGILTDSATIDFTYNDAGGTITAIVIDASITLAKMANMATSSLIYRKTAGSGAPEVNTLATLKTDLGLTGTNSGDQTTIVGITGTKAQFDTAVTDGNFLYVGDVTQYTDELAQDAVGTILTDSSEIDFTYNDATPSITASIIAGSIANAKLTNSAITIAGTSTSLGGSISQDTITGLGSNGIVKRTGANTLAIASAGTDYVAPGAVTTNGITMSTGKLLGRSTASTGAIEEITVGSGLSLSGGTLSASGSTTESVSQTSHGLSAGDLIRSNGTDNQFAKAQADSASNAEVIGRVATVTDANNFTYLPFGTISSSSVPSGTAGSAVYLSPSSAGAFTTTEPSTATQVSKPVGVLIASASKMLLFNMRGTTIGVGDSSPYSVGVMHNGLAKTYFNYQPSLSLYTASSADISVTTGGAMANFTGTLGDTITLLSPFRIDNTTLLNFSSTNIIIMDWWAKLPASGTGDVNMGFGSEVGAFTGDWNDTSGNGASVKFAQKSTGELMAVIAEEGIGVSSQDISSGLTLTNWNSYRIELDLGNEAKFYVNGSLKATLNGANLEVDNLTLLVGFGRSNTSLFTVTAPSFALQMNP